MEDHLHEYDRPILTRQGSSYRLAMVCACGAEHTIKLDENPPELDFPETLKHPSDVEALSGYDRRLPYA